LYLSAFYFFANVYLFCLFFVVTNIAVHIQVVIGLCLLDTEQYVLGGIVVHVCKVSSALAARWQRDSSKFEKPLPHDLPSMKPFQLYI